MSGTEDGQIFHAPVASSVNVVPIAVHFVQLVYYWKMCHKHTSVDDTRCFGKDIRSGAVSNILVNAPKFVRRGGTSDRHIFNITNYPTIIGAAEGQFARTCL
jgi:hypothetical protein